MQLHTDRTLSVIVHTPTSGEYSLCGEYTPKDGSLTKFICDWNRIQDVSPGVLSGDFVSRLQAINLSHNELTFLPRDFAHGAKDLRYLDISFNRLTSLPESITTCTSLQLLHLTHNHISELPDSIGQLTELRKLFLSYNRLKHIPKSIGECKKLEKVRLASNEIRFLPGSFIKLWNQPDDPYNCKGRLEELMVDRNPLVQPSITAFEMGGGGIDGLNRAFTLFWLWLQEGGEQEQDRRPAWGGNAEHHARLWRLHTDLETPRTGVLLPATRCRLVPMARGKKGYALDRIGPGRVSGVA